MSDNLNSVYLKIYDKHLTDEEIYKETMKMQELTIIITS